MKQLFINFKTPVLLLGIGIGCVLFAVYFHTLNYSELLKLPFFAAGMIFELIAVVLIFKKLNKHKT